MFNKESGERGKIEEVLQNALEVEENQMREYLITAERIKDDPELKERLENFAQGNAKRSKQLSDELSENQ